MPAERERERWREEEQCAQVYNRAVGLCVLSFICLLRLPIAKKRRRIVCKLAHILGKKFGFKLSVRSSRLFMFIMIILFLAITIYRRWQSGCWLPVATSFSSYRWKDVFHCRWPLNLASYSFG